MSQPNPNYNDGLNAVTILAVYCYNNQATYMCFDGNPAENATVKEFADSDMQPLGSNTQPGFRKGTLNLQYDLATDEANSTSATAKIMRPGFIVSFRSRYYVVGTPSPAVKKNDVIKFSVTVLELQNPFIAALLTTLGQQKVASINANVAANVSCVAIAARSGGTLTYSAETFATPGSSPPAGVTINANTGVLTVNIAAGSVDVRVVATDTLTGQNTQYGWGRYTPTAA
jgi:hypothetical protein